MKKFFVIFLLIFLQSQLAFASVEKHIDNGTNYEISYPIVYTDNKTAQNKINKDIYKYISKFKNAFQAGEFYQGKFSYKVHFEDKNYISITMEQFEHPMGAASGLLHVYGIVYDKNFGKRIPLSNFVKITLRDLSGHYFYNGYVEDGQEVKRYVIPEYIAEDYYLLGNGEIALIYQAMEFNRWNTSIKLTQQKIDWFNRKNRNL